VIEPGEWEARLGFVRDVLDGALLAAEDDRVYPDAELIRRALAYLEQYAEERKSAA
jgi:hypothetical protein